MGSVQVRVRAVETNQEEIEMIEVKTETLNCVDCGDEYPTGRWYANQESKAHRVRCLDCANLLPPPIRTVAHLHKSNAILITDRRDLIGINQKGGLVK